MAKHHKPYKPSRWNLSELYAGPTDARLVADRQELERALEDFADACDALPDHIAEENFIEVVDWYETITWRFRRLFRYARLEQAQDISDPGASALIQQSDGLAVAFQRATWPFMAWWQGLPSEIADGLLHLVPDSRYWLQRTREWAPHFMGIAREKALAERQNTILNPLLTQYLTIVRGYGYAYSQLDPDPKRRRRAYREMDAHHRREAGRLAAIYREIVAFRWNEIVEPGNFSSPISFTNASFHLEDDTVRALLQTCRDAAPLFRRFCFLLARRIGKTTIDRMDMTAPLPTTAREYTFDEGVVAVLASVERFDQGLAQQARRLFEMRHVDTKEAAGRSQIQQAFTVTPDLLPWIMVTFRRHYHNVESLGHEVGHAVHWMRAGDKGVLEYEPPDPVAEIAAIFGEFLLMDHYLQHASDEEKCDLLLERVRIALHMTVVSSFRTLFEIDAHAMILDGTPPSNLAKLYKSRLAPLYGDAVTVSATFGWEWLSDEKLFLNPFGNTAYAFAALIAVLLYQRFKADRRTFRRQYLDFLSAGGSAPPAHLASLLGIDINDSRTWIQGIEAIETLVDEAADLIPG